jgi:hypothetical protein
LRDSTIARSASRSTIGSADRDATSTDAIDAVELGVASGVALGHAGVGAVATGAEAAQLTTTDDETRRARDRVRCIGGRR